ncbi:MAG: C3HC zinc finger-like-domain-containing protein [Linnemannia elongata]|nr:MAG: C3HC zinc finger-like-domain-containing protein [Linnemannia elongata]
MTSPATNNESKRKLDESLALLNSLFAHPSKKQQQHSSDAEGILLVSQPKEATVIPPEATALLAKQHASLKKRVFLPPRPAILDKLSKLTGSRPTLQDSIAASIAASAPSSRASVLAESPSTTTDVATALTATATATTAATETAARPQLNKRVDFAGSTKMRYQPWSRDQFHDRLETFKPSTWFDKPKLVNAVECAKRGWINKGDDRLECCGGCGGVVIVRIDQSEEKLSSSTDNLTQDAENSHNADDFGLDDTLHDLDTESLGPQFHAMLTSNHVDGCPWKTHPCDDSIYKFPVLSHSHARKEFVDRAKELEKMKDDPLTESIRHPLTVEEVEKLAGLFAGEAETKLLILSLFGWRATDTPKVLACEACHTRCTYIASFGFRKTGVRDDDDDDMSMDDDGEEASFDTIQAHKWYCYWVDPEHNERRQVGWRIFYKSLISGSSGQASQSQTQSDQQEASSSSPAGARIEVCLFFCSLFQIEMSI